MRSASCVVRGAEPASPKPSAKAGAWCVVLCALCALALGPQDPARKPDVIFLATDPPVVQAMLNLAKVTKNDVVYDLGCGDGRIVIEAAKTFGAKGVGIDIDPALVADATAAARAAGVSDKVTFRVGDIFDPSVSFKDATVVMLFLRQDLNLRLRPRLQQELTPGTRVVSNSFDMGDWWADKSEQVGNFAIYLWTIRK